MIRRRLPRRRQARRKRFATKEAPAQSRKRSWLQQPEPGGEHGYRWYGEPARKLLLLNKSCRGEGLLGIRTQRSPAIPAGKQVVHAKVEGQVEVLRTTIASMNAKTLRRILHVGDRIGLADRHSFRRSRASGGKQQIRRIRSIDDWITRIRGS